MDKFKKLFKKVGTIAMAILTIMGTSGTAITPIQIHADSPQVVSSTAGTGAYKVSNGKGYWHASLSVMWLGGQTAFCIEPDNLDRGAVGSSYEVSGDAPEYEAGVAYVCQEKGNTPRYSRAAQFLIWQSRGWTVQQTYSGGQDVTAEMNAINSRYTELKNQGYVFSAKEYHSVGYTPSVHSQNIIGTASMKMPYVDVAVSANVHKASANTSITNNNPCYSLAGAVFSVSVAGPATWTGTVTTDANGNAGFSHTFTNMPAGTKASDFTITFTESTASKGFMVNGNTFTVKNGETANVPETPRFDPIGIEINKVSSDGDVISNPKSLEGAEFTVKYYAVDPSGNATGSATRTWTMTTKKRSNGKYTARSSEMTGDELYRHPLTNAVTFPLGIVTIQETKAPEGYKVADSKYININGENLSKDNSGIVTIRVISDTSTNGARINFGNEYTVKETPVRQGFSLVKYDNETGTNTVQGDAASLKAKFQVINNNNYDVASIDSDGTKRSAGPGQAVYEFYTNDDGTYASCNTLLSSGNYTIKEVEPPVGYTLNGTTETPLTISDDASQNGLMVDLTGKIADKVIRGGFKIQKNDIDYGTRNQGDTKNLQATFEIINKSNADVLVDVNGDGVLDKDSERFAPNAKITDFTTDENGYYETASDFLPYGTYEIKETVPPVGYTQDGTITKTFEVRNDDEISDLTYEIFNRVDYGKFSIHKVESKTTSDWADPEKNVEFVAVLSSKIGEGKPFASFEDAYNAIAAAGKTGDIKDADGNIILTVHEYAVVKTDDAGNATSNDLAYGTYTIKQTSHVEDTVDVTNEATFVVKEDGQATVAYTATNSPMKYRIHIVKKDADTGKTVALNSAEFKIFQLTDRKGNKVNQYVKQKVGLFSYDTFKTNSDNTGLGVVNTFTGTYTDSNDDKGSITTPLELESGTYRLEEVKTPEGYLSLDEPVEFTVKESTINTRDDDGDPIINVEVRNNKPHGTLIVDKKLENFESDQSLLRSKAHPFDYSKIKFGVYAAKDIIDSADGSVLVKSGKVAKNVYGKEVGEFYLNQDGTATIKDLPMGDYVLKEIEVPDGIVLDKTEYSFKLTQEDQEAAHKQYVVTFKDGTKVTDWKDEQKVQTANKSIINTVTKTSVSKKAVTGDDGLEGATLTIKNPDGTVVKDIDGKELTWVSGKKPHVVEGLHLNTEYVLEETIAVDGYVKATNIPFLVNEDGTVTKVTMIDKMVTVSKVDMGGKEIKGAEMSVTDTDGNVIDSWTSDGTEHKVNGLEEGKKYILNENTAPAGYVKATSIPFEVSGADENGVKVDQAIDMTDKKVTLNKTDGNGNEVSGAKITITDEDGNTVESWTSGDKPHDISGLEEGKSYTWHEDYSEDIFGYYYAEDYTFEVTADGIDQNLEMVDAPIKYQIAKVDDNGNYVKGVILKLTDITDAENPTEVELPNGGVTTEKPFELDKVLGAEHTYELVESEYVAGVYKATKMQFTVPKYGTNEVTKVTMEDTLTNVSVSKVDNHGKAVKGAKMSILEAVKNEDGTITPALNEDGTEKKPVYTFTSEDKPTDVSDYVKGSNELSGDVWYILREDEAPFGFEKTKDIPFIVNGTNETHQVIMATDVRKRYSVSAVKVDANNTKKHLKGAEITLFDENGKVVKDVNGKECKGITDGTGVLSWTIEYNGNGSTKTGYYVKETGAPKGYRINKNKFAVTLHEDYDFAVNNPIVITVSDTLLPAVVNTGDNNNLMIRMILMIAGIAIAGTVLVIKKRNA